MIIKVPYGTGFQEAVLDDDRIEAEIVDPPVIPVCRSAAEIIEEAMDHPIGTPRLEEMVRPDDRVTIIVNDQTRPGPNAEMCGEVVRRLKRAGLPDENLLFVIATGCHVGPSEEQLHALLGGLEERIRVHAHDCTDGEHVYVGTTEDMDVPVYLDKYVAASSFIVTTGVITPHHIAGFSGGRKSIVPGVVSYDTLKKHHSFPIMSYEPAFNWMEGNPFHETAVEAARMANVRFMLNVVQDPVKQTTHAVAGDMELAHAKGVELCRAINSVDIHGLADVVITSPGGFPRDMDLWQSQKAISVAEMMCVPDDPVFILCARAEEGLNQLVRDWLSAASSPDEVVERFRVEGFEVGSVKAFHYARALAKGRIILVSEGISEKDAHSVMMEWAPDLQTAVDMVMSERDSAKVKVVPRAVNIIPNVV